jgi:putative transposase
VERRAFLPESIWRRSEKTAQKRYRDFVEGQAGREYPNPFEHVTASTVLGGESFVEWVREKFLKEAQADRELPAVRQLECRPGFEAIRSAVEDLFMEDRAKARRVGLYLCRRYTGLKHKEIGAAYGVGESAVTQASRRVAKEMKQNASLRKSNGMLERELGL